MQFSGVHHIAFITNNMKAQMEFFTQVVGMKLVGLFPMHGVEGASHCFIEAGEDSYLSFVEIEGKKVDPVIGVTHAVDAGGEVAGGVMQHIAFKCDTMKEMLDLRDRLRSNGYAVFGPLDHGMSQSMYLGAPEGIHLEFSTVDTCAPVVAEDWVDPNTGAALEMSESDLARYMSPAAFSAQGGAVPQPAPESSVYPTPIPRPMFEALGHLSDAELAAAMSFEAPAE